jgi:hypothetical protein
MVREADVPPFFSKTQMSELAYLELRRRQAGCDAVQKERDMDPSDASLDDHSGCSTRERVDEREDAKAM